MNSEIFPDPNVLFRFKIDLQRLNTVQDIEDVDGWGFEPKHRMPPVDRFSESYNPYVAQIGWNPQGLFLHIEFDLSGRRRVSYRPLEVQICLMVNSRYNPSILRENEFCSSFVFLRDVKRNDTLWSKQRTDNDLLGETLLGRKRESASQSEKRSLATGTPWFGSLRSSDKGLTTWLFVAAEAMQGYRPDEFPDIGLHFDVAAIDPDRSGSAMIWNMVYSYSAAARSNPSLWPHCRLV